MYTRAKAREFTDRAFLAGLKTRFPGLRSGACTKFGYGLQEKTFPRRSIHTEISPLRCPGFPVETCGFDDLHAPLSTESRTRGRR
jgi:hypothetical protein